MTLGKRWTVEVAGDGRAELRGAEQTALTTSDSLALAAALNALAARLQLAARNARPNRRPCA